MLSSDAALVEIPRNMNFGAGEEFNINSATGWSKLNSFRANINGPEGDLGLRQIEFANIVKHFKIENCNFETFVKDFMFSSCHRHET